MTHERVPLLTEADEYNGQSAIAVGCTQLGPEYTAGRAKRVVDGWGRPLGHPRKAQISSISFLREIPTLTTLVLHTVVVDDLDYSPLLALPNLKSVRVMKVRGMRPGHDELRRRLPWSA